MKGIMIEKPNVLKIVDLPMPELSETNDVLVKIRSTGICGSDVGIYHGTMPPPPTRASSVTRSWASWKR